MSRDPHFLRPGRGVSRSRARRRRRLVVTSLVAALAAAAVAAALAAYYFLIDPASFNLRRVVVEGAEFADEDEIAAAARELTDGNILLADLRRVRAAVELLPWVRRARVRKVLPDTLRISVSERRPSAYAVLDGEIHLTDASGTLIDRLRPEHPFIGLPVISGVDGLEPQHLRERLSLAATLLEELKQRRPEWHARVSELRLESPRRLTLLLTDRRCELIVEEEDFDGCLAKYFSVEGSIHRRYNEIDYIDLRFNRRLFVKPGAGNHGG